jgi:multicomponent Na+:H+ antiporter subunit C
VSVATIFGLCAAVLIGIGVYGLIVVAHPLRKIMAFNIVGSGVFILFGAVAKRGEGAGFGGDPVPQALLITGIVVAFSATALAVALVVRLIEATGSASLSSEPAPPAQGDKPADGPSHP